MTLPAYAVRHSFKSADQPYLNLRRTHRDICYMFRRQEEALLYSNHMAKLNPKLAEDAKTRIV